MSGVNKWIGIGRLGKDPEVRHLESGATVANFSIACSESYKDKSGNRVDNTEWINIVLWKGLAEIAEKYLTKGTQVYIEGKLTTRSWEKDGITRYITEVVGSSMTMLGGNGNNGSSERNNSVPNESWNPKNNVVENEGDDLPF